MENLKEKYELKFLKMDQRVGACMLCCFLDECDECDLSDVDVDRLDDEVGDCTANNAYYVKK